MSEGIEEPKPSAPARSQTGWLAAAWRDWLARGLFEAALIVFSVLLALWLSQWAADREQHRRVLETRKFFAEEVRANRALLLQPRYLPHHEALGRGLARAGRPDEPPGDFARDAYAIFRGGIHPTPFRDAVWTSVSGGDLISRMPPREVFALAAIYRAQDDLKDTHRGVYPLMIDMDPSTGDPRINRRQLGILTLYVGDVVAHESELLGRYDTALRLLDAPMP